MSKDNKTQSDIKTQSSKRINKIIVYFFIAVITITYLSRIMHNLTITNVKVESISGGTINKNINGTSTIESTMDIPIYVKDGLYVNQIYVNEGDKVAKGDNLLQVDIAKVNEMLTDKKNELTGLELQMQDILNEKAHANENQQLQISQAQANYNAASEKYDSSIEMAFQEYEAAKKAYNEYVQGIANATETDASKKESLLNEMNSKKEYYDQLLEARDKELLSLSQAIDMANLGTAERSTYEQLQLQCDTINETIKELTRVKTNDGIIKADISGQVKSIKVSIGEATAPSAALILSKTDDSLLVKSEFSMQYKDDINVGDEIQIKSDNIDTTVSADKVYKDNENDVVVVYSNIEPSEEIVIGETCQAKLVTYSQSYEHVVPLSALFVNAEGKYCIYICEEKNTIMGFDTVAKEIIVDVLDKDSEKVAISGNGLTMGTRVIVESSRIITAESKVKIVEK